MDSGLMVREQALAETLSFAGLELSGVVVEQPDQWSLKRANNKLVATLGLAALKRLDLVVDGKHGAVYLRPKTNVPRAVNHNRLGAVFVPVNATGGELHAHVAPLSPAAEAGVCNGDVLLTVDGNDVANNRDHPETESGLYFAPAGTKHTLTVRRQQSTISMTVELRDILSPRVDWVAPTLG